MGLPKTVNLKARWASRTAYRLSLLGIQRLQLVAKICQTTGKSDHSKEECFVVSTLFQEEAEVVLRVGQFFYPLPGGIAKLRCDVLQ